MLHYIHYIDYKNIGDMLCGYYNFFQDLYKYDIYIHNISNINFQIIKKSDTVIIGGGGLLYNNDSHNHNINRLLDLSNNVIFWSLGFHNRPNQIVKEDIQFNKVALLSIRDYNHESNIKYVPCATCMIPYLDYDSNLIKRDIGVVRHAFFQKVFDYETITNSSSIENIVNFISSSNIILTNSYHAAYWSALMKKKVIIYGKFANKFDYFKYKPVEYSGNILNDIDKCNIYHNCLDESRELTVNYFKEIKIFLNDTEKKSYNIGYEEKDIIKDHMHFINMRNIILAHTINELDGNVNKLKSTINGLLILIKKLIDKIVWFIPIKKYRDKLRNHMLGLIK
ncbi:polysaccharide pyruvyl transferase family protein [Brachyspira sp. SAP_772]|uniref:polysaccharide pyruvyl transferase family protein n=1 Tax=Brachyspira sp. SAP_772 TaxID=2608385 RepID=UPI0012F4E650|nr:polysaccharide pyruvyl transferase family protein [Brachyspira sp. SAP_772]